MAEVQGQQPEQQQPGPGFTVQVDPNPQDEMADYVGRGLLVDKRALITGGDSGIGRAVAVASQRKGPMLRLPTCLSTRMPSTPQT